MKGNGIITSLSQKQNCMVNDNFFSSSSLFPPPTFFFFSVTEKTSWLESFFISLNHFSLGNDMLLFNVCTASLRAPNSEWIGSEVPPAHRYGSAQSHAVPAVISAILL